MIVIDGGLATRMIVGIGHHSGLKKGKKFGDAGEGHKC